MLHRLVHPLLRARDYQPRPEFDELLDWWRRASSGTTPGLCSLIGIGGAGKTALAERFLRLLPNDAVAALPDLARDPTLPRPANLFVFSFYDAPNPDTFFAHLAAFLKEEVDEPSGTTPSYPLIRDLLSQRPLTLLVLDGLEKVQDDGLRGTIPGHVTDGRLRDLTHRIASGWLPSVAAIITSRLSLSHLEEDQVPLFQSLAIEDLDEDAAVALFRRRGVHGNRPTLKRIIEACGYHALTLDLTAGYLAEFHGGDPSVPLNLLSTKEIQSAVESELNPKRRAVLKQELRLARIAQRYHDTLADKDPSALALLQRVCLFRIGASAAMLCEIFTGPSKVGISGYSLANLSFLQLRDKLQRLSALRLIEPTTVVTPSRKRSSTLPKESDHLYVVHPAIRDGFLKTLDAQHAQKNHQLVRTELHATLGMRPSETYPSDSVTLDYLEEMIFHTFMAGFVVDAFSIHRNRIGGYRNLGWRLAAYERGDRICRTLVGERSANLGVAPHNLPAAEQATFLNEWGLYSMNLGNLEAAAKCFKRSTELWLSCGSSDRAFQSTLNLAQAAIISGRPTSKLPQFADEPDFRSKYHACKAYACALQGKLRRARIEFKRARKWEMEHDDGLPSKHSNDALAEGPQFRLRGIWYAHFLCLIGKQERASTVLRKNKSVIQDRFGAKAQHVARCDLLEADIAIVQGDFSTATVLARAAWDWAIVRNAKELLCWGALVRARISVATLLTARQPQNGLIDDALHWCIEGISIAQDHGFGLHHIDLLNLRAYLHLLRGDPASAEADLNISLFIGVHPKPETGLPTLLASTDPECDYAWGEADARHLLAQTYLLHAASIHRGPTLDLAAQHSPVKPIPEYIAKAKEQITLCLDKRKSMQDPKATETQQLLDDLSAGILTHFPLQASTAENGDHLTKGSFPMSNREYVFISYSHADKDWLARLQTHLKPYVRNKTITAWDDTQIKPGTKWRDDIENALAVAKVAVLLVSPDFLASDFIANHELPPLLTAAQSQGLTILWVPIRYSSYTESDIATYQAVHEPAHPLASLPAPDQDRALVAICKAIKSAVANP